MPKSRYIIEEARLDNQPHRSIHRRDVRNGSRLFIPRGYCLDQSVLARTDHPHNRVYLDGAAEGPYYDSKRGIFSLDHHKGCIRQITDATCIQAINLARSRIIDAVGMDIVGNEPDADTVFASWALLNADLLAYDDRVFRRVLPLFLLEGNIDAYGLGYEELTGLTPEVITEVRRRIRRICGAEIEAKKHTASSAPSRSWSDVDFTDLTHRELCMFDQFALAHDKMDPAIHFVAQQSHALECGKTVAFAQTTEAGIYEVEHALMRHHPKCTCIVYHDGRSKWTIKLTGYVNDFSLGRLWERLNALEQQCRSAVNVRDPEMLRAHWGGSDTIGGPPRYRNGAGPFVPAAAIIQAVVDELNEQTTSGAARTVT